MTSPSAILRLSTLAAAVAVLAAGCTPLGDPAADTSTAPSAASGPADLSNRIAKALQRLAAVDASRLNVSVADGTVTLYGPLRNLNECRAAREAAWDAPGVRAVIDQMWVGS